MQHIARLGFIRPLWATVTVLAVILTFGAAPALAANDVPATTAAAQDPEAKAILMTMAEFLAKAPAFSVTIRSGYDAIQADGQYIEFGEQRRILLQRPDRARIEVKRSDGDRGLVLLDGKGITAYKADDNVYARVEKPGTVDNAIVFLVKDLQMTLPMARMFLTTFPQDLEKQLTAISYVEEDVLFDVPTDHLAARSAEVDLQLWVAQGEQPLPRRVILTYKKAPGQPQFRADMTEWNLSPTVAADSFTFTPPAGAEQIPFIVPARAKGWLPVQKGDAQ